MSALGGFVTGVLGLSLFEAVVSSTGATGRVGGALTGASNVIRSLASPDVPAIPDLRKGSATTSSAYLTSLGAGSSSSTRATAAITPQRFPATTAT